MMRWLPLLIPLAACTAHQEAAANGIVLISLAPSALFLAARAFAALRPQHAAEGDASRPRRRSPGWRGA